MAQVREEQSAAQAAEAEERNTVFVAFREKERSDRRARLAAIGERRPMPVPVMMEALAAAVPEDVVIVEEAITGSQEIPKAFSFGGAGDYFCGRGGGIGQGIAGALGVKLANPDRPVVCFSGDGSAMYSIQALWTAAHHRLPIVFIILANAEYRILKHNLDIYRRRFERRRRTTPTCTWTWSIRPWASSRWRPAWASPAPASRSLTSWPRRCRMPWPPAPRT